MITRLSSWITKIKLRTRLSLSHHLGTLILTSASPWSTSQTFFSKNNPSIPSASIQRHYFFLIIPKWFSGLSLWFTRQQPSSDTSVPQRRTENIPTLSKNLESPLCFYIPDCHSSDFHHEHQEDQNCHPSAKCFGGCYRTRQGERQSLIPKEQLSVFVDYFSQLVLLQYVFVSFLSRDNTYKFLISACLHLEVRKSSHTTFPVPDIRLRS